MTNGLTFMTTFGIIKTVKETKNKDWRTHKMQEAKYWDALLWDGEDNDWGTGTFNWDEAVKRAKSAGYERIAKIDGGYDADGNETTDPICIAEYISGEDF